MIIVNKNNAFSIDNVLFTFALNSEAAEVFDGYPKLITGIGKVNAAYELTKSIQSNKPDLIINLGSAGSTIFQKGEVICCTHFVQRDMDVRPLGFQKYETPLSGLPPILEYGLEMEGLKKGICGTGDSFEMEHSATTYNIVDMEAYALAMIAKKEDIPFLCLKYISDGANEDAATDWTTQVHNAAESYGVILQIKKKKIEII